MLYLFQNCYNPIIFFLLWSPTNFAVVAGKLVLTAGYYLECFWSLEMSTGYWQMEAMFSNLLFSEF